MHLSQKKQPKRLSSCVLFPALIIVIHSHWLPTLRIQHLQSVQNSSVHSHWLPTLSHSTSSISSKFFSSFSLAPYSPPFNIFNQFKILQFILTGSLLSAIQHLQSVQNSSVHSHWLPTLRHSTSSISSKFFSSFSLAPYSLPFNISISSKFFSSFSLAPYSPPFNIFNPVQNSSVHSHWLPTLCIQHLQSVQNSSVRPIFRSTKRQPRTPLFQEVHWFPLSCE